jgi:hypothetical protein
MAIVVLKDVSRGDMQAFIAKLQAAVAGPVRDVLQSIPNDDAHMQQIGEQLRRPGGALDAVDQAMVSYLAPTPCRWEDPETAKILLEDPWIPSGVARTTEAVGRINMGIGTHAPDQIRQGIKLLVDTGTHLAG